VLIMVSFIGEAIREAFDPRKFTRYQWASRNQLASAGAG